VPAGLSTGSGTENPGGILTGRRFKSVRQHAKEITDRWVRASRPVPQMKRAALQISEMGKNHSSEAFFGCENPLESVLFSALLEIRKLQERDIPRVDT